MVPAALIPVPDAIPVGWGWFQFLLTLTFYLHIVAMNIMLGTVIIAFTHHSVTEGRHLPLTEQIAGKLPYSIALTVNLGVAPLLFAQVIYGHFIYVSSILMAAFWLSIVALLIIGYYSAYIYMYKYRAMQTGRIITSGVTMLALLCIGFFLSNNMTLMLHPEKWQRFFDHPNGFLLNLDDPTLLPRYLHMVVSAIAVGGLAIALWYTYQQAKGRKECSPWIRYGCTWFAAATFANFGIGFWFFGTLPQGLIDVHTLAGAAFVLLLIASIVCAALSVIHALQGRVLSATGLTLALILLMVFMRDILRSLYLHPWFRLGNLPVETAWSPFLVFLLSLVAGLVLVGWMLKTTYDKLHAEEARS